MAVKFNSILYKFNARVNQELSMLIMQIDNPAFDDGQGIFSKLEIKDYLSLNEALS